MGLGSTFKEVLVSTLPIALVLFVLQLLLTNPTPLEMGLFIVCIVMVLAGFTIFLVGVEAGINPVGEAIGSEIPKRRSRLFMIFVIFAISFLVTVAEPDVTVFAQEVVNVFSSLDKNVLVYSIAAGVAVLLIVAAFRIVFKLSLKVLFTILYLGVVVLAIFTPQEFIGIAFDSGGVTTGPMTVPVLLALGIGICSVGRSHNELEGFGMIGLASVGPIVALLVMGISMGDVTVGAGGGGGESLFEHIFDVVVYQLKSCAYSVAMAIIPLTLFFALFQRIFLKFTWNAVKNMLIGITVASIGVIMFLTAIYSGFIPVAKSVGTALAGDILPLVGLGFLLGFLVAFAEPAVAILGGRVQDTSGGAINGKIVKLIISVGVATFVALGMAKICLGTDLLLILIPGYLISLVLMWMSDKDIVGIAFDAGGVSTGPMSVAIISTMYTGVATAMYTGSDAVINGFGVIALIALAPILSLCAFGAYIKIMKSKEGL